MKAEFKERSFAKASFYIRPFFHPKRTTLLSRKKGRKGKRGVGEGDKKKSLTRIKEHTSNTQHTKRKKIIYFMRSL